MSDAALPHEFQYASARHQSETAISGMWLFLATEILFFGALFLSSLNRIGGFSCYDRADDTHCDNCRDARD